MTIEFSGSVLRAALDCAAKPSKDRPEFWCSRVRVAARGTKETVVEATDGMMLVQIVMEKSYEGEAYATRDIVSRIRPDDRCQLDGLQLEVESETGDFDIRASLLAVPEQVLEVEGKNLRQWPDFDALIPKGKRSAASMIGLSSELIGKISKASKALSSPEYPLALRMEAGGAQDPVKLVGRSIFGDVVFVVMPMSIIEDEKTDDDQNPTTKDDVKQAIADFAEGLEEIGVTSATLKVGDKPARSVVLKKDGKKKTKRAGRDPVDFDEAAGGPLCGCGHREGHHLRDGKACLADSPTSGPEHTKCACEAFERAAP